MIYLIIYYITGSMAVRPSVGPVNRELVTFPVRSPVRFLKHCQYHTGFHRNLLSTYRFDICKDTALLVRAVSGLQFHYSG